MSDDDVPDLVADELGGELEGITIINVDLPWAVGTTAYDAHDLAGAIAEGCVLVCEIMPERRFEIIDGFNRLNILHRQNQDKWEHVWQCVMVEVVAFGGFQQRG